MSAVWDMMCRELIAVNRVRAANQSPEGSAVVGRISCSTCPPLTAKQLSISALVVHPLRFKLLRRPKLANALPPSLLSKKSCTETAKVGRFSFARLSSLSSELQQNLDASPW